LSRGLGKLENDILGTIREHGSWMWAVDLFRAVWRGEESEPMPYVFYSSALRAASGLVRKRLLLSGMPVIRLYKDQRLKIGYWLPEHVPPEIRRVYTIDLVERAIFREMHKRQEPLSNSDLHGALCRDIKADRWEADRLRVPLHRALKRLLKSGEILRVEVQDKCWNEIETCFILTLNNAGTDGPAEVREKKLRRSERQ
jgi:hypothetical protein